jgi:hypothetical protein
VVPHAAKPILAVAKVNKRDKPSKWPCLPPPSLRM